MIRSICKALCLLILTIACTLDGYGGDDPGAERWRVSWYDIGAKKREQFDGNRVEVEIQYRLLTGTGTGTLFENVQIFKIANGVAQPVQGFVEKLNDAKKAADRIREPIDTVMQAKKAVDKAKEISENGWSELLKVNERKVGDTIKE